jgi:protein involved in polysaccharide export with SLBB domain
MQQSRYERRIGSTFTRWVLAIALLGPALGIMGCYASNPRNIMAFKKPYEVEVTALHYILQPPDEIEIHCARAPEIDKQRQRIRPDGKVSFEAIGEIEVAGKTCAQVAALLEGRIAGLYTLPGDKAIDVRVVAFQSQYYYVLGQVFTPGRKPFSGRDTVLSALADARLNPMAWGDRVQVIRPSSDPNNPDPKIFEMSYGKMVVYGDLKKNVLLQQGDIVWVPPTVLGWFSLKLEEVLTPITRAFTGAYYLSGGSSGISPYGQVANR